ncbi:MAG: hypothetical protein ACLQUY_06600 [Ktedonobacterales bacterium]
MNPAASDRTIALYPDTRRLLRQLQFYRLLVPTPVVVVNDQGIVSHPPGGLWFTWKMAITWPEIAAMYLHTLTLTARKGPQTIRMLAIIPKDPEAFGQRHHVVRLRTFPLFILLPATGTPVWIPEALIAPVSLEDLLTQIRTRFQAEIEANGIEVREPQNTEYAHPERPERHPRDLFEDLVLDRESFRQWLEQHEGPLVGTGRTNTWRVGGAYGNGRERQDDTPLARYLAEVLGYPVFIAAPLVFPLRNEGQPMKRLPPWARAFEKHVQLKPEQTVTKEEALAALDQV